MLKFSFILPCYNVAPYIGRCLESIEHQDIPQSEYEVICVDDCSPDNLRDVVIGYQKKYSNIRLIEHTVNKTAGGARNTGIEAARGEYLWFVDPDDSICDNVLASLYGIASNRIPDVLLFNIINIDEGGKTTKDYKYCLIDEVIAGQEFVEKYCKKKGLFDVASHTCCLYRRSFIMDNNIRYPEIKSSQDVIFAWKCVVLAKVVYSIGDFCYIYHRRPNSTTGSRGKFMADATLSASLLFPNILLDMIDSDDFRKQILVDDVKKLVGYCVNDCSRNVLAMSSVEKNRFYSCLKDNAFVIDRMIPYMNRKTKKIMDYKKPKTIWLFSIRFLGLEKRVKTLLKI